VTVLNTCKRPAANLNLATSKPTAEEKALLDRELEEYRQNPETSSTWNEVEARLRQRPSHELTRMGKVRVK
jgi:hypothetical protein